MGRIGPMGRMTRNTFTYPANVFAGYVNVIDELNRCLHPLAFAPMFTSAVPPGATIPS